MNKKETFNYKQAFEQPYLFVIKWNWFPFFNGIHSIIPWIISLVAFLVLLLPLRFLSDFLVSTLHLVGLNILSSIIVYFGIPMFVAKILKSAKKDGKPMWVYLNNFISFYLSYVLKNNVRYKGRKQELNLDVVSYSTNSKRGG